VVTLQLHAAEQTSSHTGATALACEHVFSTMQVRLVGTTHISRAAAMRSNRMSEDR